MNQPYSTLSTELPPLADGELYLGSPGVERAFRWLLREGRSQPGLAEVTAGLARELTEGGFPLMRAFIAKPTLHPQIASVAFRWSRQDPKVETLTRDRDIWQSDQYLRSPMPVIIAGERYIRRRLTGPDLILDFRRPTVAILKHTNPCGVGQDDEDLRTAWQKAFETDRQAPFGGVIVCNRPLTEGLARIISEI